MGSPNECFVGAGDRNLLEPVWGSPDGLDVNGKYSFCALQGATRGQTAVTDHSC